MIRKSVYVTLIFVFTGIVGTLFLPGLTYAEEIYFAQSNVGTGNGDSCANARAISAITWGVGTGAIGAGDTAHLCGTITSPLSIGASGSAGSPITIKFEDGAIMSAPYWTSVAAIGATNKDYIVVDGGSNGIIECTANGTALANKQNASGVLITGSNNEVKNLTVRNIYVRTAGSSDSNEYGTGIGLTNGNNLSIHNNIVNNAYTGLYLGYTMGSSFSNGSIFNNTITRCATSIKPVVVGGATVDNVSVYGNDYSDAYYWDGTWGAGLWHHADGVHAWNVGGVSYTNLKIYSNYGHGDMGAHITGWVFLESINNPLIYNNVLTSSGTSYPSNAYICVKACTGSRIYNNTIVGAGTGIYIESTTSANVRNNLIKNSAPFSSIDTSIGTAITALDYNYYYRSSGSYSWQVPAGFYYDFSSWKSGTGLDAHSISGSDPLLDTKYAPQAGSPAIGHGVDLSSVFNTDMVGNPRSGTWDIGAYQYNGANRLKQPNPPGNIIIP